ncbi:MAG TPA: MotA/TolQ/ExbB proton channel family protein [Bacteroidia bacterium]|nr:MotA/TolQ/ExbB proton channel family protein [Bacteroidia bacterium]
MFHSTLLQIVSSPAVTDTLHKAATLPTTATPINGATGENTLSLLQLIMKGGYIMVPIGILSVIAIYYLIERFICIKKASKSDDNFMNNIRDFIHNNNIDAARAFCKNSASPQAKMIEKGILKMDRPLKEVEESMESTGKMEIYKLEKNLNIIAIIAGIAPMFGFIGTIMGVIKIFYNISLADNISIGLIAGGLYEKMITSAGGLIVGIFAFISYHLLNMMVEKISQRMERTSFEFIELLEEPKK